LADPLCLLDEHNLPLALDLGQRGFDLAPHLLPGLVLVVTVMQVMLRIVAVALLRPKVKYPTAGKFE
jgi:hypothetical protein